MKKEFEGLFKPIPGTRSPIAWQGGKSRLVAQILPMVPAHDTYCEAFAGAAWMLFRKPQSKVEIINDINRDLVNLYRIVKHHLDELVRQFRWLLCSRSEFERFMQTPAETLTDIHRAVRFYYLMRNGYSGKVTGQTFGYALTAPPRFNLLRVEEDLSAAHVRLSQVYVENQPWSRMLERYDSARTFFYLDPPYYGCEDDYGKGLFARAEFERMAGQLAGIAGRFIVSLNDKPEVRAIFKAFEIRSVTTRYSMDLNARGSVREVLIGNW